jgi:hypothetical protein
MSRKPRKDSDPLRPRSADPAPAVVQALERIEHLASLPGAADCALAQLTRSGEAPQIRPLLEELRELESFRSRELLAIVRPALAAWRAREDRDELLGLLGLNFSSKRRRQLTVDRDFAIALAMAEHRTRRTRGARRIVADAFGLSEREVSAASGEFRYYADAWIQRLRQERGRGPIHLRGAPAKRDTK